MIFKIKGYEFICDICNISITISSGRKYTNFDDIELPQGWVRQIDYQELFDVVLSYKSPTQLSCKSCKEKAETLKAFK